MKNNRRFISASALIVGFLLCGFILQTSPLRSSASLGRLVFTDYPKPNNEFTVDVFDLDQGKRFSLARKDYQDIGELFFIDEQYVYAQICLGDNPLTPCSTEVIAPEKVQKFDNVKQIWKHNYGQPVWSPDEIHIAFDAFDPSSPIYSQDIYVMNADGTHILNLMPDNEDKGAYFSWSPNGRQLVFPCEHNQKLCIANIDGSHLQKLDILNDGTVYDTEWSPDGSQIVFSLTAKDFHNSEIYLINVDGSNMHRLLEAEFRHHQEPKWSPDGSKIAFLSGDGGSDVGEIYVVKPDGSDFHNLSQSLAGEEYGAVWSPDSMNIAFFSLQHTNTSFLYIADASRGTLKKITNNATSEYYGLGSPELFWIP